MGCTCRYNGGSYDCIEVKDFLKNKSYIAVCPEIQGGLKVPRSPAEIVGERVINQDGMDVTTAFQRGAEIAHQIALNEANKKEEELELAILKAKSPSCGSGVIYDGTFTQKLVAGDGFFTRLLKKNGIDVISEESLMEK